MDSYCYTLVVDARANPYSPGAGLRPAALAGRASQIESFDVAMHRALRGRSAQSKILHGLRGVGKTVLLNELANTARSKGWIVASLEADSADSGTSFRNQISAALESGLRHEAGRSNFPARMKSALKTLRSFSLTVAGVTGNFELTERGASNSLHADFTDLVLDISRAARDLDTGVAIFIDEMQQLETTELAAICQACHAANQQNLPFLVVGAGLPNLPKILADAVSYAERLLDFITIGRLTDDDVVEAIVRPAQSEGSIWDQAALDVIVAASGGYPYFIQQFGESTWNVAATSPITAIDATNGVMLGRAKLDNGFFRARWDRSTRVERDFMTAMAADGDVPSDASTIAKRLKKSTSATGPARAKLISKGLVWAPEHGKIAFTVPGMADFIDREIAS